jgi:hypothetical protein
MWTEDDELLHLCASAIEAQHHAIDLLLATIMLADPSFRPSQSGVWPAVIKAHATLQRLRRRLPELNHGTTIKTDRSSRD